MSATKTKTKKPDATDRAIRDADGPAPKTKSKKTKADAPPKAKPPVKLSPAGEALRKKGIALAQKNAAKCEAEERGEKVDWTDAPKPATKAKREKKPAEPKQAKPRPLSGLDAAATVLLKAGIAMNPKAIVDAMAAAGLWSSPGGKTPHSTLYSAMVREIKTKPTTSRFRQTGPGMFEATGMAVRP